MIASTVSPRLRQTPGAGLSRVLLVVPTLNEEAGLATVLRQARELAVPTLVIDGGSTDGSVALAQDAGVEVRLVRRGKGRAWRDFLASVPLEEYEYVAMVDADGSYDLAALPRLLASLLATLIASNISFTSTATRLRATMP